ncbi:MAG TPA: ABC transporter permease [Bryobacteraceae bacterium]
MGLIRKFRALFRGSKHDAEIAEEMRFHLDMRAKKNAETGMPASEARFDAQRRFGNATLLKERTHDIDLPVFFETVIQDLAFAIRTLSKNRAVTIIAVLTLALGIGANTAIFSVIDTVLLKPLTYPDPGRIVQFLQTIPGGLGGFASVPKFNIWRKQTKLFQDVAAYDIGGAAINLTGGAFPEQVRDVHVTTDYFRLFGAPIERGRTFTAKEEEPHGPHVVVLSDSLWRQRYGADQHIVGKNIDLGGVPYEVIGIVGSGFHSDPAPDLWLPFQFDLNTRDQSNYFVVAGRLKPGITLAEANAGLKTVTEEYDRKYPRFPKKAVFTVRPLRDRIVSGVRTSLLVLEAAVGLVLLIACANVANLLLVRAAGRKREIAIRAAVGAGRGRIVRQLLTESVLLSITGGALGLVVGFFAMRGLLAVNPGNIPRIGQDGSAVTLDWGVLLFTLGVAIVTGVVFGLIPALHASRGDLNAALKESGIRSGGGFRQNKARSILVATEMALAIVLLIGAALLIRSFAALNDVKPGFDPHHLLTLQMSIAGTRFQKTAAVAQVARQGTERLKSLPGVISAATACGLPILGEFELPINIVGRPPTRGPYNGGGDWAYVSAHYFNVFRIPLIRGRFFNAHDTAASAPVVIINQAMAHQYWPKSDPLKDRIIIAKGLGPEFVDSPRQVVGIVGDVHDGGLNRRPGPDMYIPISQVPSGITASDARITPLVWIVRTRGNPYALRAPIERALRQASGGLPVAHLETMDRIVIHSTARQDFNMLLMTVFGGAAVLLAAIGIYGLMAYSVRQRTQELGIRMALGAQAADVRNLVIGQGMRVAIIGVLIGTGTSFGLTRLIESLLFGVKSWDPVVFVCVPILLALIALFAVWLPARRAARIDPAIALRYE